MFITVPFKREKKFVDLQFMCTTVHLENLVDFFVVKRKWRHILHVKI